MDLTHDQPGPSGWFLASPSDPGGVALLLWDGWEANLERGVPREIPSFVSCHWK